MANLPCNSDNLLKPNYPRKASFSLKSCCLEQEGVKIQNESYRAAHSCGIVYYADGCNGGSKFSDCY